MVRTAHSGLGVAAILAVARIGFFASVMPAALGHVDFAADDGLDVALAGFVEKIRGGEEIAVVGDSHGGKLQPKARWFRRPHQAGCNRCEREDERTAAGPWNSILELN